MPHSLFFTKASALRILPFATKIEALRVLSGSIQVTYRTKNGRCSTFISKQAFYDNFTAFRKESAKSCTVKPYECVSIKNRYDVFSTGTEKTYAVELWAGRARCSCPDYDERSQASGQCLARMQAYLGCNEPFRTRQFSRVYTWCRNKGTSQGTA